MAHRYLRCCVRRKQDMAVRCTDAENSIIKSIFPDHGRKETSIFRTALHKHRQNSGYPVVLLYVAQMVESPESLRTPSEASGNSDLDFHTRDLPENHIHNKRGAFFNTGISSGMGKSCFPMLAAARSVR